MSNITRRVLAVCLAIGIILTALTYFINSNELKACQTVSRRGFPLHYQTTTAVGPTGSEGPAVDCAPASQATVFRPALLIANGLIYAFISLVFAWLWKDLRKKKML